MLSAAARIWVHLRSGFWFLPTVLVVVHVAMAIVLTSTDFAMNKPWMERWPNLFGAGAAGARGMLSTIAGSMMTVVGVTFSMTLVTLALASSQYTSRILRNFIGDRITQLVLGLFAGVYCYCLIVLRTIRGGDEGSFVPGLAVLFGVILAVGGIGVLIYFIHHIATSIQASTIIAAVASETTAAIDRLYPEDAVDRGRNIPWDAETLAGRWKPILAVRDGYIERIDFRAIEKIAEAHSTTVLIDRATGEFVVEGTPVLAVSEITIESVELTNALRAAFHIGRHRTVEQDAGFGIRQLVDIALRALSPGVNDTTTAIMCIDYLTAILARLTRRAMADTEGAGIVSSRVVNTRAPTFAALLAEAFDQIREHGRTNFAVLKRLLDAFETIAAVPIAAARQPALLTQLDLLGEAASRSIESPRDRERLSSMTEKLRQKLILREDVTRSATFEG